MNLLLIFNEPYPSDHGGGVHMAELVNGFVKKKHSLIIFAPRVKGQKKFEIIPEIEIYRVNIDIFSYRTPILFYPYIKKIIKTRKIDYIIERYTPLGGASILAAKKHKVLLDIHSPGLEMERTFGKISRISFWILDRYRHYLFKKATVLKSDGPGCVPYQDCVSKERRIHYGANLDIPSKINENSDNISVVFVGAFHRWHGVLPLIQIAKNITRIYPNVYFNIYGDGPERNKIIEYLKDNPIDNLTINKVQHKHIPLILSTSNIAVAPFDLGFMKKFIDDTGFFFHPVKIYEYMAAALPIVSIDVWPINSLLKNGEEALLVPIDDFEGMEKAIEKLIVDKELRNRLGNNARNKIIQENWTWENHINEFEKLLI